MAKMQDENTRARTELANATLGKLTAENKIDDAASRALRGRNEANARLGPYPLFLLRSCRSMMRLCPHRYFF